MKRGMSVQESPPKSRRMLLSQLGHWRSFTITQFSATNAGKNAKKVWKNVHFLGVAWPMTQFLHESDHKLRQERGTRRQLNKKWIKHPKYEHLLWFTVSFEQVCLPTWLHAFLQDQSFTSKIANWISIVIMGIEKQLQICCGWKQ